jgi:hypothetical protein
VDPTLRFVFVSGQPRESLAAHGDPGQYGVVLEKPFSSDLLASVVRTALDQRGAVR